MEIVSLSDISLIFFIATASIVSGLVTFLISRKFFLSNAVFYIENAKTQASMIDKEAKVILVQAKMEAEVMANTRLKDINDECSRKLSKLEESEAKSKKEINKSLDELKNKEDEISNKLKIIDRNLQKGIDTNKEYQENLQKSLEVLENYASLTIEEAKQIILNRVEESSKGDIGKIVKRYEKEAKEEAKEKVGYILAIATNKYSNNYVFDNLSSVISLPDESMKGRIIGKEGRNISSLERILGVDVIIDESVNSISISCFNTYRRAIAKEVIEILIDDGRIQPAKIEDTYTIVSEKFEQNIYNEGEQIIFDLGISDVHPELIKLIGKLRYRTSYGQNALEHSLEVAKLAGSITAELNGDVKLALRAGILHDIGKALTGDGGEGSHVDLGAEVCRKYKENAVVINAIYAHHDLEEAKSIECAAVCAGDTLSAARPGARRENVNAYLDRVENIENIALSKHGVKNAYAINAGREIRVIVNSEDINDEESYLVAKEIAQEISSNVQFPGKVKVNVIRELRRVEYAL